MHKRFSWLANFNWRIMLMRIVIYAISLIVIALLVPDIYFAEKSIAILLGASIALGIISAIVKPLIQFLTFQIIFASYGIVIVLINTLLLWLLSALFPQWFQVNGFFWALVGGALLGIVTSFLEALFGLSIPIVPAEDVELHELVKKGKVHQPLNKILERTEGQVGAVVDTEVSLTSEWTAVELSDDTSPPMAGADSDLEPVAAPLAVISNEVDAGHASSPISSDAEPTLSNQSTRQDQDNAL